MTQAAPKPSTGVLLTNLGTPQAPTPAALRRYLREFLSDPRIVQAPRWLWYPILYGLILPRRAGTSAALYQRIWTAQGSPLLVISQAQRAALAAELQRRTQRSMPVALGMRYGEPSLAWALSELLATGVRRLIVLPLYPQFSTATVSSTYDALNAALRRQRRLPELHLITDYHDEPAYITALAESIREHWQREGRGDKLIFSFHGVPEKYRAQGDPYVEQCQRTVALVAAQLQLAPDAYGMAFQSRFGPLPWVQPYLEPTLQALARAGVRSVDVICPGFAADCLETLEEVSLRSAETFHAAGGNRLRYIPALNTQPAHISALADIVLRHLSQRPAAEPIDSRAAKRLDLLDDLLPQ